MRSFDFCRFLNCYRLACYLSIDLFFLSIMFVLALCLYLLHRNKSFKCCIMKKSLFLYVVSLIFLLQSCNVSEQIVADIILDTEEDIVLAGDSASVAILDFTSVSGWQATTDCEWLKIFPESGDGGVHSIILVALDKNMTGTERTTHVLLSSADVVKDIIVKQSAADYVSFSQDTSVVVANGGSLSILFETNVSQSELFVAYNSGEDWLTQVSLSARSSNVYALNLMVSPNTGSSSRSAEIVFYKKSDGADNLLKVVTIEQEGVSTEISSDYTADKEVKVLQTASKGIGLPIVIMGDGFIDTEIQDGTYDEVMEKAMENMFTEEPFKSLREYFSVYSVTAVSKNNYFDFGAETAIGCKFEGGNSTGIWGNEAAVVEYVKCVDGIDLSGVLAVVILNSSAYAGTTYFGYLYNSQVAEFAIAYCPVVYGLESETFRQVLVHEAVGHGFAKLGDEYSYVENGRMPASVQQQIQYMQTLGWVLNVDFTNDPTEVLWADFINDSRYVSEGIGIYEGAYTYISGVYRSTEESMMNSNINGFNAPSRKSIYDMVMRRGEGKESTYENFVEFDMNTALSSQNVRRTIVSGGKPLGSPHFVNKVLPSY